jgi:O-antigen ligase
VLAAAALAAFYVLALIVDRAAGVIYGLLILFGFAAIACRRKVAGFSFVQLMRRYWPLLLAMAAPLIAVLANELSRGQLSTRNIDAPSRLALFAFALWAVWLVPLPRLRQLQWTFITIFIEMGMLLGAYGLFSIAWNTPRDKLAIVLKLLAGVAILYGSYLSQSRGAWVTIPVFAAIGFIAARSIRPKTKLAIAATLIVALALGANHDSRIRERIELARNDIQQYMQRTDVDTSIGIRFQLWRGSLVIFSEHPLFGVGIDRYRSALHDLAQRKIISPLASTYAHSHNEILFTMARLGLVGLFALLALYLVPASYFVRELRDDDGQVRAAASMGLSLCLGIMVLGLTDVVLLWWEVFPFYSLGVASFIVFIAKRKVEAKA